MLSQNFPVALDEAMAMHFDEIFFLTYISILEGAMGLKSVPFCFPLSDGIINL